jgi:hypothetical protein
MNKQIRKGAFFAKAEGAPSWRDRLAKMKIVKAPRIAKAILEIDDANGETLIFPEIGDASEIAEDVAVTATDGAHVMTVDGRTFTVDILNGKVVAVTEDTPAAAEEEADAEMNAETAEFVQAVAEALEEAAEFKATAEAKIAEQAETIATMQEDFKKFKATMGHSDDKAPAGDDDKKQVVIGKKKIDFSKINLK